MTAEEAMEYGLIDKVIATVSALRKRIGDCRIEMLYAKMMMMNKT